MKYLAVFALSVAVGVLWMRRAMAMEQPAPAADLHGIDLAPFSPQPEPETSFYEEPTIMESIADTVASIVQPTPAKDMRASDLLRDKLKASEALRLTPYNLGDGGWTVGYGHFEKRLEDLPKITSKADAEALFDRDLEERAEKWVRLYVHVPVSQAQYDALTHIAFNMSPRSFKKFADEVNAGRSIADMAERSVAWVPSHLQRGIRNRREFEVNLFENGEYA